MALKAFLMNALNRPWFSGLKESIELLLENPFYPSTNKRKEKLQKK